MSWFYRHLLRPALFTQNAEAIHNRTMRSLGWAARHPLVCQALQSCLGAPELPVELFGLRFPNPVGLAAGMDKQAEALLSWEALGFGFSELGAVTWHGQPGNDQPRVFRAIPEEAIVNRMGFNNPGAEVVAQRLAECRERGLWPDHPVGMNLGKSKITPLNAAAEDYANSFRVLRPYLDFFVVNVSSPNTPNLRQLQDKSALDEILAALQSVQKGTTGQGAPGSAPVAGRSGPERREGPNHPRAAETKAQDGGPGRTALPEEPSSPAPSASPKPILVKVAPDLSFEALDEILELVGPRQVAGIVATNTTITRPQATQPEVQQVYAQTGGLSGRPLRRRSTEVIRHLYRQSKGNLPIIGVGGIFTAADAWEKVTAGASLLQIYTGLVYEGPSVVKAVVRGLRQRLEERGFSRLSDAVGVETK